MKKKQPRIIIWDIETSEMIVKSWGLWNQNHSHKSIVQDWNIICISWKVLGKKKVHTLSLDFNKSRSNDYDLCKDMRDILVTADALVHHNGNAFDLKKFNARLIYHSIDPLPPIICIDTLKEARKIAKFSSNRLDYLGTHLGLGAKLETGGQGLWDGVRDGDPKALQLMISYCEQDVLLLERIYLKLRGYMKSHPNLTLHTQDNITCPKCGSHRKHRYGTRRTASGMIRQQYQCLDCYGYYTLRVSEKEKPKTQN
jgi:DNA polymerase III epsilon subunit-like protein